MKKRAKKRKKISTKKLSIQKIFNIISGIFILACIIFYGSRFLKVYKQSYETTKVDFIADTIKTNNVKDKNLKNINGDIYFYGKEANNYIAYSNLIWRIVKISPEGEVTIALDNNITALAKGKSETFEDSYIYKWLNKSDKEYTGIFEDSLNNIEKYLTDTNTCIDNITDTKNITCNSTTENTYLTIPSLNDYVNTGGAEGFLNNMEYYYLTNNEENYTSWCVDKDGKISTSDGADILGIKPVITLKSSLQIKDGNGTKDTPYTFEEESSLIGSYIKLDNDIWRVYKDEGNIVKLSLDNYLSLDNEEVKYKYSGDNYYHNSTISDSLAYYLNKTYLNSLKYKDIIEVAKFSNGIYNNTNNYNYLETLNTKVSTKIAVLSIGDIILNPNITNYFLSSGISKESNMVYTMQNDFKLYTKVSTTNLKIVPVIAIKKELVTEFGTKENPLIINYE